MPKHAPVTSAELHRVLDDLGVSVRTSNSGGCVATVDGTEIRIPLPHKKHVVSAQILGRLAKALGAVSYSDLLSSLLHRDPIKAGRPSGPKQEEHGPSKEEARHALSVLRARLAEIDDWLKHGSRSGAVYKRLLGDLKLVEISLDPWPPPEGDWLSPDDTGYAPSAPDSVTVGTARATGITALAVRRGETLTRWQHKERS